VICRNHGSSSLFNVLNHLYSDISLSILKNGIYIESFREYQGNVTSSSNTSWSGTNTRTRLAAGRLELFVFITASTLAVGLTQLPIQWLSAAPKGIKGPKLEAGHSSPSNAESQERMEIYLHSPTRFPCVVLN
jgi:hypothetical protein